jgi:hypothetical protein
MEDPTLLRPSISRRGFSMVLSARADACQRADRYAVGNGRRDLRASLQPKPDSDPRAFSRGAVSVNVEAAP